MAQALVFNQGNFESNAIKQVVLESNKKNVFTKQYLLAVNCTRNLLNQYTACVLSNGTSLCYATIGSNSGTYKALSKIIDGEDVILYPISIPAGKTSINVKCTGYAPCFVFYDKDNKATDLPASVYYRECAKVVGGETPISGTPYSISSWTFDERTISIPEGATGFTVSFECQNATKYNAFDLSKVIITFS